MRYSQLAAFLVALFLSMPMMVSCGQKEGAQAGAAEVAVPEMFAGEEKPLVAELFKLWTKKGHVASIDQAANVLGVTVSDSIRVDLLNKFRENLTVHERLGRYRANTFVLSNEEKLIAEFIMAYEKRNGEFPTLEQVAAAQNLTPERVKDRLKFMSSVEFFYDLGSPDEYNKLGFSYGHKKGEFVYDLGTRVHEFRVDGGKPFNVGCAKEALFIVASEYPKNHVEYRTYDPMTLEPVEIVFEKGEIQSIKPEVARILEGGTCGTNNIFANEGTARASAATMPKFQAAEPPVYELKPRFEDIKKQAEESKQQSGK